MLISLYLNKTRIVGTIYIVLGRGCSLSVIFKKQELVFRRATAAFQVLLFRMNATVVLGRMFLLEAGNLKNKQLHGI